MNDTKRVKYFQKQITLANKEWQRLAGFNTAVKLKLQKGLITQQSAQFKTKVISDRRKTVTDYIEYHKQIQKLLKKSESGLKRKKGRNIMLFNKLRNTGVAITDILLKNNFISRPQYNKLYKNILKSKINLNKYYIIMEQRQLLLILSSHSVKDIGINKPGDFKIKFNETLNLDPNKTYEIGLNKIINMSFTWYTVTDDLDNRLIRW